MTGTPDAAKRGHATAEPRSRPPLEPAERLWLENYLERLKKAPGGLLKRLVVYGSKARGDAGPTSDVDVLVDCLRRKLPMPLTVPARVPGAILRRHGKVRSRTVH